MLATREIGRAVGGPGPTLIAVAGIHGNEPAGIAAVPSPESAIRWRPPS